MCNSWIVVALIGLVAHASESSQPKWIASYADARLQAKLLERPIVVVVGTGKAGWSQLSRDGELGPEINKLLARNYVCVYVNLKKKAGQQLADALEFEDGPGIVISSPSGKLQAFRHEGDIDNDDLADYLKRYANPDVTVETTETLEGAAPAKHTDGGSSAQGGACRV